MTIAVRRQYYTAICSHPCSSSLCRLLPVASQWTQRRLAKMQQRRCYRRPDSNVRALEEALGAAPECRLCIVIVPPEVQGWELADFLSGAALAASGHAVAEQPNAPAPCRECGIRANNGALAAVVSFRTAMGASVAFWLDGLELRSVRLTIRRPPRLELGGRRPVSPPETQSSHVG